MTILVPMRQDIYDAYLHAAIAGYAEDNIASGRWPRDGALERSRADFARLLPLGLATPDNYLFEIKTKAQGSTVGFLWFAVEEQHGIRSAFVYDVEINEDQRRRGHATRAFEALEPIASALGVTSIGLHVFGHNAGAQALYEKLGYAVTDVNMVKRLDVGTAKDPGGKTG